MSAHLEQRIFNPYHHLIRTISKVNRIVFKRFFVVGGFGFDGEKKGLPILWPRDSVVTGRWRWTSFILRVRVCPFPLPRPSLLLMIAFFADCVIINNDEAPRCHHRLV